MGLVTNVKYWCGMTHELEIAPRWWLPTKSLFSPRFWEWVYVVCALFNLPKYKLLWIELESSPKTTLTSSVNCTALVLYDYFLDPSPPHCSRLYWIWRQYFLGLESVQTFLLRMGCGRLACLMATPFYDRKAYRLRWSDPRNWSKWKGRKWGEGCTRGALSKSRTRNIVTFSSCAPCSCKVFGALSAAVTAVLWWFESCLWSLADFWHAVSPE